MHKIHRPASNSSTSLIAVALLVAALDIAASWFLARFDLGRAARIVIALLPIPANAAFIALVIHGVRRLDEFQKRIHFEAVVLAFLSTGLAALMYGYLEKAHVVGALNVGLVWAFMCLSYAIGYVIAARHYR